jgi:hypothetical protein
MPDTFENVQANTGTGGARFATQQYTISAQSVQFPISIIGLFQDESTSPICARGDQTNGLDVDVTRVQGTVTVSGTVSAAQSGTWTVQPGNTANTTPWLMSVHDGTTKATVRALANAALNVAICDGSGNQITSFGGGTQYTEDAASAGDPVGNMLLGRRRDTLATETTTDGDNTALNCTGKGELYVKHTDQIAISSVSGTVTVSVSNTPSVSQSGTWNIGTVSTVTSITNSVAVTLAAGASAIAKAEDSASGDADVGVPALAVRKGTPANTSGTDGDYEFLQMSAGRLWVSATIDSALPSGTNTIGNVGLVPITTGGLSIYSFLSTAAVQAANIKGSAGQVYSIELFNVGSTAQYVRLYNQATSPGSTDTANIVWRGIIPGNTAGAGFVKTWPQGLALGTGIGIRVTGAIADNDNTALAANTIIGNVTYK